MTKLSQVDHNVKRDQAVRGGSHSAAIVTKLTQMDHFGKRNAFRCSVGADLGRAAEKPLVADR